MVAAMERVLLLVATGLLAFSFVQLSPGGTTEATDPAQVGIERRAMGELSGQRPRYTKVTESVANPAASSDSEQAMVTSADGQCQPINSYVFVKTHKTGGSTLANVLHRRTWKHRLRPVLPKNLVNMGWPNQLTRKSVLSRADNVDTIRGDVLMGHLVMDDVGVAAIAQMVPHGRYITILRDPITRLLSAFKYYGIARTVSRAMSKTQQSAGGLPPLPIGDPAAAVREFAARADEYMAMAPEIDRARRPNVTIIHALVKDSMAFDLGFAAGYTVARQGGGSRGPGWARDVDQGVARIASQFDLVLINEYWDESMILLRRTLCWDLEDVVYNSLKAGGARSTSHATDTATRASSSGGKLLESLPPKTIRDLRQLVELDTALYAHFNRTFWRRVAAEKGFYEEVATLRRRVAEVRQLCTTVNRGPPPALLQPSLRGPAELCVQQEWENVKFGCEIAKRGGDLPPERHCKDCVFGKNCIGNTKKRHRHHSRHAPKDV